MARVFWTAFVGGFVGKVIGALFLTACLFLGFGPDKWVEFVITGLPVWITPLVARSAFFILGLVAFVTLAFTMFGVQLKTAAPIFSNARFAQLASLRTAISEVGWNTDVNTASIGANGLYELTRRLRQAAVRGEIAFQGRKYRGDWTNAATDQEPLVPIKPDHFRDFGFDVMQVGEVENYRICTGKLGQSPDAYVGQLYRDIHVNEAEMRAWLASDDGRAPEPLTFLIWLKQSGATFADGARTILSLLVQNKGTVDFTGACLVKIEGIKPQEPAVPLPMPISTESQIIEHRRGRFTLARGEPKSLPIILERDGEWHLRHEAGDYYRIEKEPVELVIGVYGVGAATGGRFALDVMLDELGTMYPTIKEVDGS